MPGGTRKQKAAARQHHKESVTTSPTKSVADERPATASEIPAQEAKKEQVVEDPKPTGASEAQKEAPKSQKNVNTILGLVFIPVVLALQLQDFVKKWATKQITTVVTRVQTTIQKTLTKLREIKAWALGLFDRLIVQPVLTVVKPVFDRVVARITTVVNTVINFVAPIYNQIKATVLSVVTYFRGWFTFFLTKAKAVYTTLKERVLVPACNFARGILATALAVAGQAWTRLVTVATSVQTFIRQVVARVRSVWIDLARPTLQKLRTQAETRVLAVYATVSGFLVKSGAVDLVKRAVAQAWIFIEAVRQRVFATTAVGLTLAQRWLAVGTTQASKAYDNAAAFIAKLPFVQSLRT